MSTTLTNGLKLPDKGSVDWYADMQSNYTILDGAVGTIAEHTSALAGKAPLVHTHTKSDITDFPAYGSTAGTICEGNDSRLSDARTPVAHTHTKSDVTDLFNSANTWTSLNTYNGMILLKSSSDVTEQFKQKLPKDVSVSTDALVRFNTLTDSEDHNVIVEALGHWSNYVSKSTSLKYKNDSTKQGTIDFRLESSGSGLFYPQSPFECYLGNSSNQWKSVYAQSYYYNGIAWGLDKANTWSGSNTYRMNLLLQNTSITDYKSNPSSDTDIWLQFWNNEWRFFGAIGHAYLTTGVSEVRIAMSNWTTSGAQGYWHLDFGATKDFSNVYFSPSVNNLIHLGTSDKKWKTFNGINPGALSIFNPSAATQDPIDIPNTWVTDGSAWNTLNVSNMGDGWICLAYRPCGTNDYILARFGGTRADIYPSMIFPATMLPDSKYYLYVLMPVAKAMGNIYLEINLDSNAVLVKHSFIPAYGTV